MRRGLCALVATLLTLPGFAQNSDKAIERFILAYLPYLPGSTVELTAPSQASTPNGPYLAASAVRTSIVDKEKEQIGLLVDPTNRTISIGLIFQTPPEVPPDALKNVNGLVENILPQILNQMMSARIRTRWPSSPARPGAVLPFDAEISTGYGWMKMPAAVSADGRFFLLGGMWSLDRDPRAIRREILANAPVQWDPGHENALIKLVEFSDFQCPACKRGWTMSKEVLARFGDKIRHGLMSFPLTNAHPWAFRAAVAGLCVGQLSPDRVTTLKEELYSQQESLTLDTVDGAILAFVKAQNLDLAKFRSCFMTDPSVEAVLKRMELGQRLGVSATPTNYANGEIVPFGNREVWEKRIQAIISANGLPENAAEIRLDPTPVPTVKEPAKPTAQPTH